MAKVDGRTKEARAAKAAVKKENEELLQTVRDRYEIMVEADRDNRLAALEDIRFVNIPGAQWEANMKQERDKRPCYEFNKTRIRAKRVVNDIRDNRPQGKVRAVEDGDTDTAEIYDGLTRNIWNVSHGDNATDYAAEFQVEGGMGAWRLNTVYADDSAFDQDIVIENIENPFCLYVDPNAKEFMKRDADDWVYTERISHKEFEERYGEKVDKSNFETDGKDDNSIDDWLDEETVRIAEYWFKEPHKKELWLLELPDPETGEIKQTVVDSETDEAAALLAQGFEPSKVREVETHKIMMVVASGAKILEGPTEWAGHHFPWVMVFGEYKVIDGKKCWWGIVRHAKDAQRNYNISKTAIAETIAQAPKAKFWATPKQAEGLTEQWAIAHKQNLPFQLYNVDQDAPGPPTRMGGADIPVALMQQAAIDNEDLKDVMGVPDANLGVEGGEKSGRAIFARQQEGEITNFNFKDNMAKAVERTYELLIDLIPQIYDTDRELRILGADGSEAYKRVNQVVVDPDSGKSIRINDLSAGKYDVTVTVGPSFSTLRQEAAEIYGQLGQQFPQLMQFAGDLIFKSMDLPYADDIAERLKAMLPPEIQQIIESDSELPPEVQQAKAQVEAAMAQVQQHGQLVQAASDELEKDKSLNEKQKAEIKTELANVRAARAEFDAHVAEQLARLVEKQAGISTSTASLSEKIADARIKFTEMAGETSENLDENLAAEAAKTVQSVDKVLSQFMQAAGNALRGLEEKASILQNRKPVDGTVTRQGGRMTANVKFDDGSEKSIAAVREKGGLRIVPDAEPDSAA